eukprot:1162003-Pelagomonas_calceolata.AAC.9
MEELCSEVELHREGATQEGKVTHTHCTCAVSLSVPSECHQMYAHAHTRTHAHVTTARLYHQGGIPANPQVVAIKQC